ncbi:Gfo/Idh/MocA family oxidoreductase [Planctomycetota bacterium]
MNGHKQTRPVLGIVGCGNLFRRRLRLAAARLLDENMICGVVGLDIHTDSDSLQDQFRNLGEYIRMEPNNRLPARQLKTLGCLILYIGSPSSTHVTYAMQATTIAWRVAIEKPLSIDVNEAERLIDRHFENLFPVDHYTVKDGMEHALRKASEQKRLDADGFEFVLLEQDEVGDRDCDEAIFDTGCHGIACLRALIRAAGHDSVWTVTRAITGTYRESSGRRPRKTTAARIEGIVSFAGCPRPFVIKVGKALDRDLKALALYRNGQVIDKVSLNESGSNAHYLLLRRLIAAQDLTFPIDLGDSMAVVRTCDEARGKTQDYGYYEKGSLPPYLRGGIVSDNGVRRPSMWDRLVHML